jgi:acetylglutamate kinase
MAKPKLWVFKIGGKVIDKPEWRKAFLQGFATLPGSKLLVHGGGLIAEQLAARLGIENKMIDGRRVTSKDMRDLVTMVYGGGINKSLVAELQGFGCDALGLTGADGQLIRSQRRLSKPVDFGYVGDVTEVRTSLLLGLLGLGLTPVFAPLSYDDEILNSNADGIASALAQSLTDDFEVHTAYAFEAPGVMMDLKDPDSLIPLLTYAHYQELLTQSVFTAGMLPKLEECFKALNKRVQSVVLADAENCLRAAQGEVFYGTRLVL